MTTTTKKLERTCWRCNKNPAYDDESLMCRDCLREAAHDVAVDEQMPTADKAIEALHRLAGSKAGRDALVRRLEREHRTNQQLVCVAIVAMLGKWNNDAKNGPGFWDLRNEAAVQFATEVFKNVPEKYRYFPYI